MAKIPNASYWSKRMDVMQQAALDKGEGYMENLEKQFELATASLDRDISLWYQRFAENNEITYADAKKRLSAGELKEFKWTVEEYIKHAEENELSGQWIKELENASARIHISRLDALKLQLQQQAEVLHGKQGNGLNSLFSDIYADGYYTTAFELQKGIGMGWAMQSLNPKLVEQVLSRPWTEDNNTFSDRIWTHKQELINSLNTHITQMVIRGDPPKKAIALLAQDMRVAKNKAARLVMTEAAAFASAAQKDCFRELGVERYQIIATRDSSTSQTCRDMDSKIFDIADYQVGLTAPPFHPFCRTVTAPFYEDMEKLVDRARRDPETDKTVTPIPRTMTAQEWRDQFIVPNENYSEKAASSDVKNLQLDVNDDIIPQRRIDEIHRLIAEEYSHEIREDRQGRHIPSNPFYIEGKSILTADPTELIWLYAGKSSPQFTLKGAWREREDFQHSSIIGIWKDLKGNEAPTTRGVIHYSRHHGAHIVPHKPINWED